ncbi:MAG: hypothetical protein V4601_04695 [Pseudomonadota bacterium]
MEGKARFISKIAPVALSAVLLGLYYFVSLFVFILKAAWGEAFLVAVAVALVVINLSRKYVLLHVINVISFVWFIAYYAKSINAFGVACAVAFLVVTTGIALLVGKLSQRQPLHSMN